MTITPSTIALVAVITSGTVGIFAPVISAWITMQGKKYDRLMAVDGRVSSERTRIYMSLVRWALATRAALSDEPEEEIESCDLPDDEIVTELQIFGSRDVREAVDKILDMLPHALARQVSRGERVSEIEETGFRNKISRFLTFGDSERADAVVNIDMLMKMIREEITEERLRSSMRTMWKT